MLLQRKNDSREASSTSLMRYARSGRRLRRVGFDAEQELGADEQPVERELDSLVEASLGATFTIEREQRPHVGRRHRPAKRAARERGQDPRRTCLFTRGGCAVGVADRTDALPARRVGQDPLDRTVRDLDASEIAPVRVSAMLTPAGYGRRNGRRAVSAMALLSFANATCTTCGPAFTGTRTSQSRSARLRASCPWRPPPRPAPPARAPVPRPCPRPAGCAASASPAAAGSLAGGPAGAAAPASVNTLTRSPSMLTSRSCGSTYIGTCSFRSRESWTRTVYDASIGNV